MRWWLCLALALSACDDGGGGSEGAADAGGGGDMGFVVVPGSDGGLPPPPAEPPVARFSLAEDPATTPLAAIPFPSDVYRKPDGTLDLRGFPQPLQGGILGKIITSLQEEVKGFGTSATFFLSFESRVDASKLPQTPAASLEDDASVFVVDVDPESPERGRRWPVQWRYDEPETQYLPSYSLRVRLVEGIALRPLRQYALVATTAVAVPAPAFLETLRPAAPSDAALARAWQVNAPLRAWLAESGVEAATASVFTTQDSVGQLFQARDFIHGLPDPELLSVRSLGPKQSRFELFEGLYRAPRFQEGTIPYQAEGEGAIRFDADGNPIIQGYEDLRFSLSVPLGEPPPDGWPLVLYAHGTGGDYSSYVRNRAASILARSGLAVLAIDQIHHGTRDNGACDGQSDTCVQLLYFNFLFPKAGKDNTRQAALDYVSLLQFAKTIDIPAEETQEGFDVTIDPDRIMFMGHSQGGLNGPLFMAIEPEVRGGMLSGAGASIAISIEQKTEPVNINAIVRAALALPAGDVLDRWHPTLAILQTFIDASDSVNYARFWFDEPAPGNLPKSVFMTAGLEDEYTPPDAIFALAAAGRVPIVEPVSVPIEALDLLGIAPAGIPPYRGNVAGGEATAGLAQFPGEGHFVIFDVVSAQQRYTRFLQELSESRRPQVF
ncbi:MAG: hypothetical protein H6706_26315 [Myxococcales bacterium]|nr:hypothetical protein [Myxococcales bacterium]